MCTTTSLVETSQLTQTPVTEIGWGRKGGRPRIRDNAEGRKDGREEGYME